MGKNKFKELMSANQKMYLKGIVIRLANIQQTEEKKTKQQKDYKNKSKKMDKSKMFMAIAKGKETTEGFVSKYLIGLGQCGVLAVNPNKAEIEKLTGRTLDDEPIYIDEVSKDGKMVKRVRIDFYIKPNDKFSTKKYIYEDGTPIETVLKHSYFITCEPRISQSGTYQIIDKYGQTAWASEEEINQKTTIFTKKDGSKYQSSIDATYRKAFNGEDNVIAFIKAYLGIPNPNFYDTTTGSWKKIEDPSTAECMFENPKSFFTGNISEIKDAIAYQPNNLVKIAFGIKTTDDGKMYQATYKTVLKKSQNSVTKLVEEIKAYEAASNVKFLLNDSIVDGLQEYNPTATNLSTPTETANPFESNNDPFASPF